MNDWLSIGAGLWEKYYIGFELPVAAPRGWKAEAKSEKHWETASLCEVSHKIWHHIYGFELFYRQQSAKTLCFGVEDNTWFKHDNLTFALPCFQNPKLYHGRWSMSQCSAFLFLRLIIKLHDLKDVNLNSAELPCAYHKGSQFDFSQPNQKVKVSTTVGKLLELSGRTTDPNLTPFFTSQLNQIHHQDQK